MSKHWPFCFSVVLFSQAACGMFHKRAGPDYEGGDSRAKRLRANIADAFLTNERSGRRAQSMFEKLAACLKSWPESIQKLAGPKLAARKFGRSARNLRRRLFKNSKWPGLF